MTDTLVFLVVALVSLGFGIKIGTRIGIQANATAYACMRTQLTRLLLAKGATLGEVKDAMGEVSDRELLESYRKLSGRS